jgi:hypothetical protein
MSNSKYMMNESIQSGLRAMVSVYGRVKEDYAFSVNALEECLVLTAICGLTDRTANAVKLMAFGSRPVMDPLTNDRLEHWVWDAFRLTCSHKTETHSPYVYYTCSLVGEAGVFCFGKFETKLGATASAILNYLLRTDQNTDWASPEFKALFLNKEGM